jgi:hypothetical protein
MPMTIREEGSMPTYGSVPVSICMIMAVYLFLCEDDSVPISLKEAACLCP